MTYRKCVFAGTFDPPTLGHKALIEDCLRLFDEVAVAVMVNPDKRPFFTDLCAGAEKHGGFRI